MPPEKALEDLFDPLSPFKAGDDPFAQLGEEAAEADATSVSNGHTAQAAELAEPSTRAAAQQDKPSATVQPALAAMAEDDRYADLLAEFDADHPFSPLSEVPESAPNTGAVAIGIEENATSPPQAVGAGSGHASALLAADGAADPFDQLAEETFDEPLQGQILTGKEHTTSVAPTDHGELFGAEHEGSSVFDDLLQQPQDAEFDIGGLDHAETPSHDLSFEQTIQPSPSKGLQAGLREGEDSFASDWLADTTVDQSFDIKAEAPDGGNSGENNARQDTDGSGSDPVPFEVPQGWYNESGEWHWYTDEEREQVRLTMLGEQPAWEPEQEADQLAAPQPPFLQTGSRQNSLGGPYSPALESSFSENAARRTPQPEQSATIASNPYDPYEPPSAQPTTSDTSYYPSSGNSSAYYDSYASSSGPSASLSPYAPQQPAYAPDPYSNPYAPSASAQAYPLSSGYTPNSNPPGVRRPPSPPKSNPPQRMASTAYDPPFLRAKKSVAARSVSAAPAAPAFGGPLQGLTVPPEPQVMAPPAAPAPAAPPPGPPRRPKSALQSERPQFDEPPLRPMTQAPGAPGPSRQEAIVDSLQPNQDVYAPQQSAYDAYAPPQVQEEAYPAPTAPYAVASPNLPAPSAPAQPPSPKKASYSAFDPPLKPPSASRPLSAAASGSGAPTPIPPRSQPAPPPAPAPSLAPPPPPSGPARKASPAPSFEGRPPSRQNLGRPPSETFRRSLDSESHRPSSPLRQSSIPDQEVLYGGFGESDQAKRSSFNGEDPEGGFGRPETDRQDSTKTVKLGETDLETPFAPGEPRPDANGYIRSPHHITQVLAPSYEPSSHQQTQYEPPSQHSDPQPSTYQPQAQSSIYQPQAQSTSSQHDARNSYQPSYPLYSPPLPVGSASSMTQQNPYDPNSPYQRDEQDRLSAYNMPQPKGGFSVPVTSPYRATNRLPPPTTFSRASSGYTGVSNAYAPSGRTSSPPYGSGSEFGSSPMPNYFGGGMAIQTGDHTYTPQQVMEQRPVSEDPLGRCTLAAQNVPMAVFGLGGVIVTAFPGLAEMDSQSMSHARTPSYGYASGRQQVWIRPISDVVSTSAFKSNEAVFPGPLLLDPTAAKGATAEKKKREAVSQYLEARAEEIQRGLPYLSSSASAAKREQEGKLVLVRLLAAMLIGEGRLGGKPEVDEAVRKALSNPAGSSGAFSSAPSVISPMSAPNQVSPFSAQTHAAPAHATPSQLTHLSELLTQGDKQDAAMYAAQEGLWSHALVIGSNLNPELWREIVSRFAKSEFGGRGGNTAAMRASYALFSGVGANTLDDLMEAAHITDNPGEDRWREVIAAVGLNARPTDLVVLDELGRRLQALQLKAAAQVCFLLSPTSPFLDNTLASFEKSVMLTQDSPDEDSIVFAEIAEYARSLVTLPKGQELPFPGLPQLLPVKLHRAWVAAELGETDLAVRYCRAIATVARPTKTAPGFLAPAMMASLQDLLERLTGTPSIDPAKGLGARKGGKTGVDKLGSWIEGRLTKFIAGDDSASPPQLKVEPQTQGKGGAAAVVGPFSHFSSISPAQSGNISRTPSTADLNGSLGVPGDLGRSNLVGQLENRLTPQGTEHSRAASNSSLGSYGDQWGQQSGAGGTGYAAWGEQRDDAPAENQVSPGDDGEEGEFINPMAALQMNSNTNTDATVTPVYQPSLTRRDDPDDDEDDLGFGNSALSRTRTPRPAGEDDAPSDRSKKAMTPAAPAKEEPAASPSKTDPKTGGSWLGRWWGKKEGEGSGPVRAKLGEESSMVFDQELKRWVVKGQKPEAAAAPPPPPPTRAQTTSPAQAVREKQVQRAVSATPPPGSMTPLSQSQGRGPPGPSPLAATSSRDVGGEEGAGRASSEPPSRAPPPPGTPGPPGAGAPPPPIASGVNGGKFAPPPGTSIDDLLSRPSSTKSTGSRAAKKGARNRYVDVFQPHADGS